MPTFTTLDYTAVFRAAQQHLKSNIFCGGKTFANLHAYTSEAIYEAWANDCSHVELGSGETKNGVPFVIEVDFNERAK